MANWLIDQTDLYAIKYDLLREARVGDAVLGVLGLAQAGNGYESLVPGGLVTGWLPEVKKTGNVGSIVRSVYVLMLDPVTVRVCKKAAAFQVGARIYKKKADLPYDGVSTPAQWHYTLEYTTEGAIAL